MGCTHITKKEEFILLTLYEGRCLNSSRAYHNDKLEDLFTKRFSEGKKPKNDFKKSIQCLRNLGYITAVKKKKLKYYISDAGLTIKFLMDRGYLEMRNGKIRVVKRV